MKSIRQHLSEFRQGFKILCSKRFWRDFRHYYSSEQIAKRLDNFVQEMRVHRLVDDFEKDNPGTYVAKKGREAARKKLKQ